MKRPHLIHFLAILNENSLNIRASVTVRRNEATTGEEDVKIEPRFPIQAYKLLNSHRFTIKVIGLDDNKEIVFKKSFDSDAFGSISTKIHLPDNTGVLKDLKVFEVSRKPGIELLLGTFTPVDISKDKKIVICDLDKTLVDTRYSTPKEVYRSLTSPLQRYPTLENSVSLLKEKLDKQFQPFIVSASPHFYEEAIRDWLANNNILTAGIFLKDYRQVFSILEGFLTPKDLKVHGLYKFSQILDIILMTGMPEELILMGDNYESDPLIYMILTHILLDNAEPRMIWNEVKEIDIFKLNRKQDSLFLNKLYQICSMRKDRRPNISIYIRRKGDEKILDIPKKFNKHENLITVYSGSKQ
jgi:hypothetical protein